MKDKRIQNGQRGTGKVTPEILAQMVDLLPTIGSLRDLCAITGLRLDVVRREVAPFLAIMKLQGTHPICGCGKLRFHPYACSHLSVRMKAAGRAPVQSEVKVAVTQAQRTMMIEQIMTGDRYVDIEQRLGMKPKSARWYHQFLTAEQKAERSRMEMARMEAKKVATKKRRGQRGGKAPAVLTVTRPFRDALYARIASAVPRWVTEATRDDVISEMYLAVQNGTLAEAAIEPSAKRFATSAVAMWENRFGPRSLDERLFDDAATTIADMIPDPRALAAFDHTRIGAMA